MRTRIITSKGFTGDRMLAAILFEGTVERQIEGVPSATYLWQTKNVVPFVKVHKGLAEEAVGVQVMQPTPGLDDLLARARDAGVLGTKMRSVFKLADEGGIRRLVQQQFEVGQRIFEAGPMPILEPEVDAVNRVVTKSRGNRPGLHEHWYPTFAISPRSLADLDRRHPGGREDRREGEAGYTCFKY